MASLVTTVAILVSTISSAMSTPDFQQYPRARSPGPRARPRWDPNNIRGIPPAYRRPAVPVDEPSFVDQIPEAAYRGTGVSPVAADDGFGNRKFYPDTPDKVRNYPRLPSAPTQDPAAEGLQIVALKRESLAVRQKILDELRSLRQLVQAQNLQRTSRRSPSQQFGGEGQEVIDVDGIGISLDPDSRPRPKILQMVSEKKFRNPHTSQFRDFWDYDSVPIPDVLRPDPVVLGVAN